MDDVLTWPVATPCLAQGGTGLVGSGAAAWLSDETEGSERGGQAEGGNRGQRQAGYGFPRGES